MNLRRAFGALVLGAGLISGAIAQEPRPKFFFAPIAAVAGLGANAEIPFSPATSGMINAQAMGQFLNDEIALGMGEKLSASMREHYKSAVVGLNQIDSSDSGAIPTFEAGCPANFRVRFNKAFAVVLGISRFSFYPNIFPGQTGTSTVQILIPVTYTLRFIELTGGTTAYSKSLTIYTRFEGDSRETFRTAPPRTPAELARSAGDLAPRVRDALRSAMFNDAARAIATLVSESRKEFSPSSSAATVLGSDRGYVFLDKGSEIGVTPGNVYFINVGDAEATVQVQYATTGLSVVTTDRAGRGLLKDGVSFSLDVSGKGADSAKPTVMAVPLRGQLSTDQVRENALVNLIAADLGKAAPFNIVVNDEEIKNIKTWLRGKFCDRNMLEKMPGFTRTDINKQKAPDFYLRLDSATSPIFQAVGVGGVTTNDIFINSINLSLVDNQTLIRQAAVGTAQYELKITSGRGLSPDEAREINMKNAALIAAEKMVKQFRFDVRAIKVASSTGDSSGPVRSIRLAEGMNDAERAAVRFVRPLTVPKSRRVILLPLDAEVERGGADPAALRVFGEVREGDLALVDSAVAQLTPMTLCEGAPQRRLSPAALLSSPSSAELVMARTVSASLKGFRLAEPDPVFIDSVKQSLKENFFEDRLVPVAKGDVCLLPMELQNGQAAQCDGAICKGQSSVGSGIRVFEKGKKVAESLRQISMEIRSLQVGVMSSFVGLKAHEFQIQSATEHINQLSK